MVIECVIVIRLINKKVIFYGIGFVYKFAGSEKNTSGKSWNTYQNELISKII